MSDYPNFSDLLLRQRDDVLIVELNRPERRNAMSVQLRQELLDCFRLAETDESIRGLVVTGAGDRAFSAGADIEELQERTLTSELARPAELRRALPRLVETLAKPVVAAINGWCLGAGLELALGCTVRIASSQAKLGLPEINLGVIPGSGGTQRMTRLVGVGWSMQLILSGEPIGADVAERIGLVTQVVDTRALIDRACEIASLLGGKSRVAFIGARDAVLAAADMDLTTGIEFERKLFALCAASEDKQVRGGGVLGEAATELPEPLAVVWTQAQQARWYGTNTDRDGGRGS